MKYIDLENKTLTDLLDLLKKKKIELFTLRVKHKTMQLKNTCELKVVKKDIARIKTKITFLKNNETDNVQKESKIEVQ